MNNDIFRPRDSGRQREIQGISFCPKRSDDDHPTRFIIYPQYQKNRRIVFFFLRLEFCFTCYILCVPPISYYNKYCLLCTDKYFRKIIITSLYKGRSILCVFRVFV